MQFARPLSNTCHENAEDFCGVAADVVVHEVNGGDRLGQLEKFPDFAGRDGSVDGGDRVLLLFVEALRGDRGGEAWSETGFDVFVFGCGDRKNGRIQGQLRKQTQAHPQLPRCDLCRAIDR